MNFLRSTQRLDQRLSGNITLGLFLLQYPSNVYGPKTFKFNDWKSHKNNSFFTLALKIISAFLKNCPKKLFSNCLVDGLLTFIVLIFKHSKCCHSLLQVHLRVCNTHFWTYKFKSEHSWLRSPMQRKGFRLFLQWIV